MIDNSLIDRCVDGLDYPADVHRATEQAERNGCPRGVVSQLQSSQDRTYASKAELLCRLGDPASCFLES